jgi:hypothetical protein
MRPFVGAASTGIYGVMAMDYVSRPRQGKPPFSFKQTVFFLEDMHLTLVTGIRCQNETELRFTTSLEQKRLAGPVHYGSSVGNISKLLPAGGRHQSQGKNAGAWVHHDNTAYLVVGGDSESLTIQSDLNKTADWAEIGVEHGAVTADLFTAFVHYPGQIETAVSGGYSHSSMVVPGVKFDQFRPRDLVSFGTSCLISNTGSIQAALWPTKKNNSRAGALGAVFYSSSQALFVESSIMSRSMWNFTVQPAQPCIVLVERGYAFDTQVRFTVSDPSQTLKSTVLRVGLKMKPGDACCGTWNDTTRATDIIIKYPQAVQAGKPSVCNCISISEK